MLGSLAEAEESAQEAWLRINRSGGSVDNFGAWLWIWLCSAERRPPV